MPFVRQTEGEGRFQNERTPTSFFISEDINMRTNAELGSQEATKTIKYD